MIFQKYSILLLLISLSVIQNEIVFAENNVTSTTRPIPNTPETISMTTEPPINSASDTSLFYNETTSSTTDSIEDEITGTILTSEETTLFDKVDTTTTIIETEDLKRFHYVIINENTGVPCTLSKMGITLIVPYKMNFNTIFAVNLTVPLDANVTGTCEENISVMTLAWKESETLTQRVSDGENTLTMRIKKDGDIFYVQDIGVSIFLDNIHFPNATERMVRGNTSKDLRLFPASLKTGIHVCHEMQEVKADPIMIHMQNVSLIAFNNDTNYSARKAEYCSGKNAQAKSTSKINKAGVIAGGIIGGLAGIGLIIFIIHRSSRRMSSWNIARKS